MRNAFYINEDLKNKTITKLTRVYDAMIHAKYIETVVDAEIENNKTILSEFKHKAVKNVWFVSHIYLRTIFYFERHI